MGRWMALVAMGLVLAGAPGEAATLSAAEANARLGRGINLGNALEAPEEGRWGMRLEATFFDAVKDAGFQSVRIPIRWSAHAGAAAPYTIDPAFRDRVDWALDQAARVGLVAVINVHHYEEVFAEPSSHRERFLGLWRQIAPHYRNRPDTVYFELLNEPHAKLTDELWNEMLVATLGIVRASNPDRMVIVGPGGWNNIAHLPRLTLPEADRALIVTVHYYSPFEFTHQGAAWVGTKPPPLGRSWTGSAAELAALAKDFGTAAAWGKANQRPLYVGEFGAYEKADMTSRALWTRAVRDEVEKHGMSWAYWEFGSGFGAYDRAAKAWRKPLVDALVGR